VDARWLERAIRAASVNDDGLPWDATARAALRVADVIQDDLEKRHSPEPIELGCSSAVGLLHALQDDTAEVHADVARSDGVAALYLGLRRLAHHGG
jgi:hypothetical protein